MHYVTTRNAAAVAAFIFSAAPSVAQDAAQTPAASTGTAVAQAQPPVSAATRSRPASASSNRLAERSNVVGGAVSAGRPCTSVSVDPPTYLTLGKSQVVRLNFTATRIVVGGSAGSRASRPVNLTPAPGQPGQASVPGMASPPPATAGGASDGIAETEITLLGPNELFFLGRKPGSMNVVLQGSDGRCVVKDIVVTVDPGTLQSSIATLMPDESGVKVHAAESSLVLTGSVSDPMKLDQVLALAGMYGDGKKVVNMLRVNAPQQVMLEVKIAEVSKTLLDKFGLNFSRLVTSANGLTSSIVSGIVGGAPGLLGRFQSQYPFGAIGGGATSSLSGGSSTGSASVGVTNTTRSVNPDGSISDRITYSPGAIGKSASLLNMDAVKSDGIVRILAEPNIMAISGQLASFRSGGTFFIPVPQGGNNNGITLEEKDFGVGLKFTPTVLDGSRINLKLYAEASDLSQTGTPFVAANGVSAILPSLSVRKVDTTVQLNDGQSFVVAGLIKNNLSGSLDKFPGLGEAPVVGALFRSQDFQSDRTELMFIITPRLVKPFVGPVTAPTDNHIAPDQSQLFWSGQLEGQVAPQPAKP